jgi:hypothetical protein
MTLSTIRLTCVGALASLSSCLATDPTSSSSQSIDGPYTDASTWQRLRAIGAPVWNGCTATKIAPNFAVSAAHCGFSNGMTVAYYGSSGVGTAIPYWDSATITGVYLPPCVVNGKDGNKNDCSGLFSDIAVIQLDAADTYGVAATLAWTYPGTNAAGQEVGRGLIDGNPNPNALLLQVDNQTSTSTDSGGSFWAQYARLDHGDSGGPFYVGGRVLGTAVGYNYSGALYTSIPQHLDWILTVIQYYWSGNAPASRYYNGSMLEAFWSTEQVCQYACDSRSDCQAYNYILSNGQCQLMSNVSGPTSAYDTRYHGALHYAGARASRTSAVVGWQRSLTTDSIVHVATDGHVHHFDNSSGSWNAEDASGSAPQPSSGALLTAYRRADGSSSILYRSGDQLVELNRGSSYFDTWHAYTFPLAPNTTPVGDPATYVRADGLSAVLYRTSTGHIIEVSETMSPTWWSTRDLTAATGVPVLAASDPTAYVRSDGVSSVLYRSSDDQIFELYMSPDHYWDWGEPSVLAGAPAAAGKPAGYTHHDETNAIVYATTAGRVEELWLDGDGWHAGDITGGGASAFDNPVPYVRTDAIEAVDYFTWDYTHGGQVWEIANAGSWIAYDLNNYVPAGYVHTEPAPFVSHDGWDTIAYGTSYNHANTLTHEPNVNWRTTDLTLSTGETP